MPASKKDKLVKKPTVHNTSPTVPITKAGKKVNGITELAKTLDKQAKAILGNTIFTTSTEAAALAGMAVQTKLANTLAGAKEASMTEQTVDEMIKRGPLPRVDRQKLEVAWQVLTTVVTEEGTAPETVMLAKRCISDIDSIRARITIGYSLATKLMEPTFESHLKKEWIYVTFRQYAFHLTHTFVS